MIATGTLEQKIGELLELKYAERGIFLLDTSAHGSRIEVTCDADSGLSIDDCAEITRYLRFHLEHEGLMDDRSLQVSSPGLDKPLKLKRQYKKNVGRLVEVKCKDESIVKGRLVLVDDAQIVLHQNGRDQENQNVRLPWLEIGETRVKPDLNKS